MRKYNRNEILVAIIFSVSFALFATFIIIKENSSFEKESAYINSKYSEIKYKDSISSVISETYYPEGWRASEIFHNFTLLDGRHYQIEFLEDLANNENDLSDALHKGAIITKFTNSDIVYIMYLEKKYVFKIDVEE